ncbi:MAG: class B sortase [Clostridia bacterium]|nr:class B sortase [Clostridia bacterium]
MNDNKENNSALRDEYPEQETEFTASLSDARPSDISKNNEVTRKKLMKTALSGAIRYTAMLACFLVFLGAAGYVASYAIQYMEKVQESAYFDKLGDGRIKTMMAGMADVSVQAKKNTSNTELGQSMVAEDIGKTKLEDDDKEYNEYFEKKRAQVIGTQRSYPDVFGWIDVPGTKIDYIVMQGKKSNNEYLYTNYDGKYTRYGSIFADWRNSRHILENKNTIIYGHNMNTAKIMFAPLLDFATNEKAFRNQLINVITPDGLYTYELFSIYDTYASDNYIEVDFATDEEFIAFCEYRRDKSIYKKDVTFTADSKILTLSTCTVRGDGMRWALHAVLIGVST